MRKKLVPIPKLVKKLDDVFQMYVRYRDDFTCCTCGRKFTRGERTWLHAGHYISRGVYATRWNEKNVNAQCAGCNLKQSLADVEVIHTYEVFLKTKYGDNVIDELLTLKHTPYKLNRAEIEDKIHYYTEKLDEYKRND
jgi:hypothetical protein